MSRIGKKAVLVPATVKVALAGRDVKVEGPKGKLQYEMPEVISARMDGGQITVTRANEERKSRALHGLVRSLIANMVEGAQNGFMKKLEIQGVGFKASVQGKNVNLNLGFSHPVLYPIPDGVTVTIVDQTGKKVNEGVFVVIEGADKQKIGAVAADIRRYYPPEPYKGKGVRYAGEQIIRKEGKTAQSK